MARRRKILATGRNAHGGFLRLDHGILDSEAWRHLSPRAVVLLLAVWRRHNGANNGAIPYSVREARELLGCGPNTASEAFGELIDRGFLRVARESTFRLRTKEARAWTLTMERVGEQPGTRDFRDWRPPPVTVPVTVKRPPRRPKNQKTVTAPVTHGYSLSNRDMDETASSLDHGYHHDNRRADIEPFTVTAPVTLSRSTIRHGADEDDEQRASSVQQPAAEHHDDAPRGQPIALADRGQDGTAPPFGTEVRSARQRRRWTQQQLADLTGITRGALGNIETGRYPAGPEIARVLCDVLAIQPWQP